MQDTKSNELNRGNSPQPPERPTTVKPVKGTFKQSKKKLGQMLKNAKAAKPRKGAK